MKETEHPPTLASTTDPVFDGPQGNSSVVQLIRDITAFWEQKANRFGLAPEERDFFARARYQLKQLR